MVVHFCVVSGFYVLIFQTNGGINRQCNDKVVWKVENAIFYSQLRDSSVPTPVLELVPVADGRLQRYLRWYVLSSVSVQSEFSMDATPSKRVFPTTSAQNIMGERSTVVSVYISELQIAHMLLSRRHF